MDFFHSLPVPEFWEWIFFIPFPFPKFGIGFFYSLLVPKFWEWAFSIPFPFPNFGNGIFYSCSRSRTLKSHSRSPLKYSFRWQPFVTCFFWHHGAIPNHCNFASSFDGNLRAYLKMHHFTFRRKAVLTHFNCDWCGKLLFLTRFWESNATFWRQTVSTCNHATCVIILHLVQTIWDSIQNIQWRKINKCSQWDFASSEAGNLRAHLKTHVGHQNAMSPRHLCGLRMELRKYHLRTYRWTDGRMDWGRC